MTSVAAPRTGRRLPIWGYIVLVVGYLLIIQLVPKLTAPADSKYATYPTTKSIATGLWVTVGLGSAIGLIAVAVLGWWRPAFIEDRRLPRWAWWFPALMVLTVIAGISYATCRTRA